MVEARIIRLAVDTWSNFQEHSRGFDALRRRGSASRPRLRPACASLDLHLSADAIAKRLSDMTDADSPPSSAHDCRAPIVLEATAEVPDDAGDVEDSPPDALA